MLVDSGVAADALDCPQQVVLGQLQLLQPEVHPAQAVEVSAVVGVQLHRPLNHLLRFLQLGPIVGQHIAQVVQGDGAVRVELEHPAEFLFCLLVFLLPLVDGAAQKVGVLLLARRAGESLGFVHGRLGVGVLFVALIDLRQAQVHRPVFGPTGQQRARRRYRLLHLSAVAQQGSQLQLEAALFGEVLQRLPHRRQCSLQVPPLPVGFSNLCPGALRFLRPQRKHRLKSLDRRREVFRLAVERTQPLQNDGPGPLLLLAVAVARPSHLNQQVAQYPAGLAELPARLVQ